MSMNSFSYTYAIRGAYFMCRRIVRHVYDVCLWRGSLVLGTKEFFIVLTYL